MNITTTQRMRLQKSGAVSVSIPLQKGDTVPATITQNLGKGNFIARYHGTSVAVVSQESLLVGTSVMVGITVATPPLQAEIRSILSASPESTTTIAEVLKGMGMSPTAHRGALARRFLELALPLNSAIMKQVEEGMLLLKSGSFEQQLDTVLLAVQHALPGTSEVLTLLHQALWGNGDTGSAFKKALSLIQNHVNDDEDSEVYKDAAGFLESLLPEYTPDSLAQALKAYREGYRGGQREETETYNRTHMLTLLRALAQLRKDGADTAALTEHVRTILDHYHGEALVNSLQGVDDIFMTIPLVIQNETKTCRLHIRSVDKEKTGLTRLHFSITTLHLGTVEADVVMDEDMVDCTLQTDTADATQVFVQNQDVLETVLRNAAGGLAAVTCKTDTTKHDPMVTQLLTPDSKTGLDTFI